MPPITFNLDAPQGPLPTGLQIHLVGDYIALVGANNAAKTSILQAIFRKYWNQSNSQNKHEICLILPERIFVDTTTQTGSRILEMYNHELTSSVGANNGNRAYMTANLGPQSSELPKLLLNHWNFYQQLGRLNDYFRHFGLPEFILDGPQEIKFEDVQVAVQGSGLRSIFAILAALTDDHLKLLLIDEPEQSLEAGGQKSLSNLFYTVSREQGKQIIVTTHSHLFLNRKEFASNYAVTKANGQVSIKQMVSEAELYDITLNMLGSSVEDLFFPNNFLIVEGSTDQLIIDKVVELKGIDKNKIKVVSASG